MKKRQPSARSAIATAGRLALNSKGLLPPARDDVEPADCAVAWTTAETSVAVLPRAGTVSSNVASSAPSAWRLRSPVYLSGLEAGPSAESAFVVEIAARLTSSDAGAFNVRLTDSARSRIGLRAIVSIPNLASRVSKGTMLTGIRSVPTTGVTTGSTTGGRSSITGASTGSTTGDRTSTTGVSIGLMTGGRSSTTGASTGSTTGGSSSITAVAPPTTGDVVPVTAAVAPPTTGVVASVTVAEVPLTTGDVAPVTAAVVPPAMGDVVLVAVEEAGNDVPVTAVVAPVTLLETELVAPAVVLDGAVGLVNVDEGPLVRLEPAAVVDAEGTLAPTVGPSADAISASRTSTARPSVIASNMKTPRLKLDLLTAHAAGQNACGTLSGVTVPETAATSSQV